MNKIVKMFRNWWLEILLAVVFFAILHYWGLLKEALLRYNVAVPVIVYLAFDVVWCVSLVLTLVYTDIFRPIGRRYKNKLTEVVRAKNVLLYFNPFFWLKVLRIVLIQTLSIPREVKEILHETHPKTKHAWFWFWVNVIVGLAQPSVTIAIVYLSHVPLIASIPMYVFLMTDLINTALIAWRVRVRTRHVRIRQARVSDIDQLLHLEEEAWLPGQRADKEMFESCIKTFPEGTLVAEEKGIIDGVVVTQIVNFDPENFNLSWYEATDSGCIRKTHNPHGDTLYGVNLSVSPHARRSVSELLLESVGKLAIAYNLRRGILGGRIPRYYRHKDRMTAREYIRTKTKMGRPIDPELYFYQKAGLKVVKVLPNYFEDPESCNYGVLLAWENPFYPLTKRLKFLAKVASSFFRVK